MIERSIPIVLLIDNTVKEEGNKNHRIKRLEDLIRSYPLSVSTVRYENLTEKDLKRGGVIAWVLSGSRMNISDPSDREKVSREIELVRRAHLPVLGICFGFHLVLHSFGCKVMRNLSSSEAPPGKDIIINVHDDKDGLLGNGDHPVNVSHRDYVPPDDPVLSRDFHIHSISRDGPFIYAQYVKHKIKPIYALQFHPEAYDGAPEGVVSTGMRTIHAFLKECMS